MKIAICLSGQPRYLEQGYEEIKKTLISKYEVDFFAHTWWSPDMIGRKIRNYTWSKDTLEKIMSYYKPVLMLNEPQKDFYIHKDIDSETCQPISVYSMFYSLMMSNKLKSLYEEVNKFKYDIVIRCRFDIKFDSFNLDLSKIDLNKIYLYKQAFYNNTEYPNDQFAISNSKNMDYYSNTHDFLEKYYNSGFRKFVGEHLLLYHLKQSNIKIEFTDESNMKNDIIIL